MAGDWDNTKTEGTEQQMKVAKIHMHPKWTGNFLNHRVFLLKIIFINKKIRINLNCNAYTLSEDVKLAYDIAVIELETNVTITDFVTIASLPDR